MTTVYIGALCLVVGFVIGYLFSVKNAPKVNADIAAAKAAVTDIKKV